MNGATPLISHDALSLSESRVLILAPTGNDARLTADFLLKSSIPAEACRDVPELCAKVEEGCAALLLAEETLANGAVAELVKVLDRQPPWSDIPITIITSGGEASRTRLRRLAIFGPSGNVSLLERPFRPETLVSTIEVALRARRRQHEVRRLLLTLQDSEDHLNRILGSISDAFIALDREWLITYVNRAYMELVAPLYQSADDLLGHSLWECFPDIVDTDVGRFYQRALEEQKAGTFEVYYKPLRAWLELRASPAPQTLSIYVRNISERKKHEAEVATLTSRVQDQARLFDATLSHIADLAYTYDCEGRVIYANKPLLEIWGRPLEDASGKTLLELGYPPELAARLNAEFREVVETGGIVKGETTFTSAAGVIDYHEYIFNPIFDAHGKVVAIAGTTRLITERKRIEADLEEAKNAAEAANRSKDHFLAVLSHELRTPLTPVLMTASALEMDPAVPSHLRADMAMIRRNVELETKLIDDLLDLSRITTGKLILRPQPIDLNEAVRQVCGICRQQVFEKGVRLQLDLDESSPWVCADPARLQQMLWNILKNAAKFTDNGGDILVSTRRHGDKCGEISVRDSGIGIEPETLPRIFDAFEQGGSKVTRQFGGLGLGLAITKALAELHDGSIRAESAGIGTGSTFTVSLPSSMPTSSAGRATGAAPVSGGNVRILVVEDHVDTAAMLARLLGAAGYVISVANTAQSAVEAAGQEQFDLVISDLGLPDATGYELMRRLNEQQEIKGIAMSGYGMEDDIRRSFEAGFSEHLVKPVDIPSLERAIRQLLVEA